ncbi:MAG: hypothetical protein HY313_02200 [Acidobacteria bacterium]|nr:hypothetical protein [Acidobacteriota bacterium]
MLRPKDRFLRERIPLATLALCVLTGFGCGSNRFVDTLNKVNSGDYELVRKDDLLKLRGEAALGKGVGRYQQYSRGERTFRLDTATGETCLLLATEEDWKKPEVAAIACRPHINWIAVSPGTVTGTNDR